MRKHPGLSGFMRAKNEELFIGHCIDSVINALDELIVVYNDCIDKTEEVLKLKQIQYPDKIKIFKYPYHILAFNLSHEEYEYACNLPKNSERLFASQCNFALDKIAFTHALVIDPDQLYFEDEIKYWRDVCKSGCRDIGWKDKIIGRSFAFWISAYRNLSLHVGTPLLKMIPEKSCRRFYSKYLKYSQYLLSKGECSISLSGFNIFYNGRDYLIPFDDIHINPPYNGEGDHLIFTMSEDVHYVPLYNKKHLTINEKFCCNKKIYYGGPSWFHFHANRESNFKTVLKLYNDSPNKFASFYEFSQMDYSQILKKMPGNIPTLFQKTLFAIIHNIGKEKLIPHQDLLKKAPILKYHQDE